MTPRLYSTTMWSALGQKKQQILFNHEHRTNEFEAPTNECFYLYNNVDSACKLLERKDCTRAGILKYYLGHHQDFGEDSDEADVSDLELCQGGRLMPGTTIWFYRHALLTPLMDGGDAASIQWEAMIDQYCDSTNWGLSDPVHKQFYKDALTSELYGPADLEKWIKLLWPQHDSQCKEGDRKRKHTA